MVNAAGPLFSVVIPVYNRAGVVMNAINSIREQSFQHFEIVIADDGSTDDTSRIVKTIDDERIQYFYQENAGPSAARNLGALKAKGEYLVFLDSDDHADKNWLHTFYEVIQHNANADLICCGIRKQTKENNWVNVLPESGKYLFKNRKTLFLAGAFCVRRSLFLQAGGYDIKLKFSENTDLRFKILKQTESVFHVDKILVNYCYTPKGPENKLNKAYGNLRFINNNKEQLCKSKPLLSSLLYLQGNLFLTIGRKRLAKRFFLYSFQVSPFKIKAIFKTLLLSAR